jgi:hypothetical protein
MKQFKDLVTVVATSLKAKQAAIQKARDTLSTSRDPEANKQTINALHKALMYSDSGRTVQVISREGVPVTIRESDLPEAQKRGARLATAQ